VVHTEVGSGLFDFGFVDGPAREAMFQHPLGLAALTDGSVVVADTYNGAIRRFDPESRTVTTLATELVEPTGVTPLGEYLLIVESGAHRLTRIRAPADALPVVGRKGLAHRPKILVGPGGFDVLVEFTPPPGQKLDNRYGPSTHLVVSSSPTELVQEGAGSGVELSRRVVLCKAVPGGVLHVSARAASCDTEQAEFPACYVHQQDWGVPVTISEDGDTSIRLILSET
jgi:hypothetical protein